MTSTAQWSRIYRDIERQAGRYGCSAAALLLQRIQHHLPAGSPARAAGMAFLAEVQR